MIGRGDSFDAYDGLWRGELARALALAAGLPQRIPSTPSFNDVGFFTPFYPYVESVAGARARRVLMDPKNLINFGVTANVSRLDFAVALVRGAGLEAEAQARAGESLGLLDETKIPYGLRGYVAVALERGLIDTVPDSYGGEDFNPKGNVPRVAAARFLMRLLELK
ncbi:MAG: hypothetical protein DMF51_09305 [Acidobacteria bacterium]|nr:MAG: hypothetical protein DMF51_09305 [Acidobacteriota bacterium]